MTIQVGDKMPAGGFGVMTDNGPGALSSDDLFGGKKVVLFAVPGAFTPTCSAQHLPGFIDKAGEIKAKGVDTIACLSVNDVFVMDAWQKATSANDIQMLADGNAEYTKALGLELDASGFGMGTRSQRFALVVDDGIVSQVHLEPGAADLTASSAENILANV
ncbi:MAG: peroxiredoxin [Pseudomonadota bacterium]